jgi:hypothetical protein
MGKFQDNNGLFFLAQDILTILEGQNPGLCLLRNVTVMDLKTLMKDYIQLNAMELKTNALQMAQNREVIQSDEYHSFLPDPPHPFLFTLDALIADSALGKETRKRLEVAAKYFKDNSSL